ncbi:MAG: paraquat-inducible protein A [Dyella sp.]
MRHATELLICEHCDTVYRRHTLARGEVAHCARCAAVIERHPWLDARSLLALALTALIVFVLANLWPIVSLRLNGDMTSSTLWGMIMTMWTDGFYVVSVLAAATLFFFPLVKMLLLGWVLLFASFGRRAPGFGEVMTVLHYVGPWTMSEVFVLGALVAVVKASAYFQVIPNVGIYAYGVLMLLITVFSGVDLRQLWDELDEDRR